MKPSQFMTSFAALSLAASVTSSSMYASVKAAVQQDEQAATEFLKSAAASDEPAEFQSAPSPANAGAVASLAPEEIRHDREQQVVLDANGGFTGRLSALGGGDGPAAGYTVKLIQNRSVKGSAKTDDQGRFKIEGVEPGVGGILAYSPQGLMMFGARFVAPDGDILADENVLDVDAAVVMSADVTLARRLITESLSSNPSDSFRFTEDATDNDNEFEFGSGQKSTSLSGHQVKLKDDGSLHGVVNILDERTGRNREIMDVTVNFLRDGQFVHASEVNSNGEFIATNLIPGLYSVVGTGRDGVFAIGLDILGSTQQPVNLGDALPVSLQEIFDFSIAPINPQNLDPNELSDLTDNTMSNGDGSPVAGVAPPGPAPAGGMAGPGGGGGFSGGGGGIGGGGGLGALLGAGIAGAVGYLAGQNDDPSSPGI